MAFPIKLASDELFHCDDTSHGYGCFHLDPDLSNLTKEEQTEWKELLEMGYDEDNIADVDKAIERAKSSLSSAEQATAEAEGELEDLNNFRRLWRRNCLPRLSADET